MPRRPVTRIFVRPQPGRPTRGRFHAGPVVFSCALGRVGTVTRKREGDGGTPLGRFRLLAGYFRPDRVRRRPAPVALRGLSPSDGWCDDAGDRLYNRPVRLPYRGRHERLYRPDGLYDVVFDLSHNRLRIVRGRGSAIFLHCARPDLAPTEGCVAVPRGTLLRVLPLLSRRVVLEVGR